MSEAHGRPTRFLLLLDELWNLGLLLLRNLQPVFIVALIGLVAWALLSRQPWPFSINADSEHVSLLLAHDLETQWRIDGALLCVRAGGAAAPALGALPALHGKSPCPGRRWRAYDLRGLDEVTLRLPASLDDAGGYTVRLDAEPDGGLALQVGGEGDGRESLVLLPGEGAAPVAIGTDAILRFPPPAEGRPPARVLLPFSGAGAIGKDVSWREPTLLRRGSVSLYTRSDEAVGGRELVASTELLPGDRVDLGKRAAGAGVVSKGFIHFDLLPQVTEPVTMNVVAFGEAEAVRIVRFGEQGYSFAPGLLARLTRHSAVSTWAVLIVSLLGFMSVYQAVAGLGHGEFHARRRRLAELWRDFRGAAPAARRED